MNLSGESLSRFWDTWVLKYRNPDIWDSRLIVLRDELDLPIGNVKYKPHTRSTNGHNGLRSMVSQLDFEWSDVAIGIDRPQKKEDIVRYVLSPFNNSEKLELFKVAYPKVRDLLIDIIDSNSLDVQKPK